MILKRKTKRITLWRIGIESNTKSFIQSYRHLLISHTVFKYWDRIRRKIEIIFFLKAIQKRDCMTNTVGLMLPNPTTLFHCLSLPLFDTRYITLCETLCTSNSHFVCQTVLHSRNKAKVLFTVLLTIFNAISETYFLSFDALFARNSHWIIRLKAREKKSHAMTERNKNYIYITEYIFVWLLFRILTLFTIF